VWGDIEPYGNLLPWAQKEGRGPAGKTLWSGSIRTDCSLVRRWTLVGGRKSNLDVLFVQDNEKGAVNPLPRDKAHLDSKKKRGESLSSLSCGGPPVEGNRAAPFQVRLRGFIRVGTESRVGGTSYKGRRKGRIPCTTKSYGQGYTFSSSLISRTTK